MLTLEPKTRERIILFDSVSDTTITIQPFRRDNGVLQLGIDAPMTVDIRREKTEGICNGQRTE